MWRALDKLALPFIRRDVGLICDIFIFKYEERLSMGTFSTYLPERRASARGIAFTR